MLPVVLWGMVLLGLAFWRTVRPLGVGMGPTRTVGPVIPFLVDTTLIASAIVSTGYWESPYALCLLTPVVAAGFSRGYGFAVRLALAASIAVSLPYHVTGFASGEAGLQVTAQWVIELLLVAALAGYARRLFGEAEIRHSQTMDR
ncbi:MAG: hypothetical protein ACRD12_06180, partial [Acidimicrobiales bacterium]